MSDEIIKPEFLKCLQKTGVDYYKKSLFWVCVLIIVSAVGYGLLLTCMALLPAIVGVTKSIPAIVYLAVGVLLAPGTAAAIVCYIRYHKKKIEDVDKGFVCPE